MRPGRDAPARDPHGAFTTASLLRPMVADMRINDLDLIHPVTATVLAVSSGRLGAFVAAVVALAGVVIGGRALARSAGRARSAGGSGDGRGGSVAIVLGLVGLTVGGLITATSDDGVGSGNGLGGAVVAMVLGLIAVLVGGLARARTREVA